MWDLSPGGCLGATIRRAQHAWHHEWRRGTCLIVSHRVEFVASARSLSFSSPTARCSCSASSVSVTDGVFAASFAASFATNFPQRVEGYARVHEPAEQQLVGRLQLQRGNGDHARVQRGLTSRGEGAQRAGRTGSVLARCADTSTNQRVSASRGGAVTRRALLQRSLARRLGLVVGCLVLQSTPHKLRVSVEFTHASAHAAVSQLPAAAGPCSCPL